MSLIRAFIAIPLPADLQERIHREIHPLRSRMDHIRWVAPQNIHLTLKFLGDTPKEKLDALEAILAKELTQIHPFEILVRKIGAFPNLSRPSVIWLGVEGNEQLSTLHRCIQAVASEIESVPEKRHFSAHITLGRVRRQGYNKSSRSQIRAAIEESPIYDFGKVSVNSVHLFESKLKAKGAEYRSLFKASLGDFLE